MAQDHASKNMATTGKVHQRNNIRVVVKLLRVSPIDLADQRVCMVVNRPNGTVSSTRTEQIANPRTPTGMAMKTIATNRSVAFQNAK